MDGGYSNTLTFTNLPRSVFDTEVIAILKRAIESYATRSDNDLYSWIPLPSFGRAIAIFWDSGDAQLCKQRLDRLAIGGAFKPQAQHSQHTQHIRKRHRARSDCAPLATDWNNGFLLRVFSLPPTPTPLSDDTHTSFFLTVPGIEKNFLISPPGSPPVGWEPIKEDAPNTETLAEDLIAALTTIRGSDDYVDNEVDTQTLTQDADVDVQMQSLDNPDSFTPQLLITPQPLRDIPGVSIANYTNVAMPSIHTEPAVGTLPTKATAESMRGAALGGNSGASDTSGASSSHTRSPSLSVPLEPTLGISSTIKPTARPPV
ncbi:hypothetical protein E3P99_01265 [Wallemia hederae]|uniref:Calcipressin n=1 Tax=Wallemia hederae TaxID=1540922 RepID=A0A4T0FSR0_9BASI|nr:hypothetical protein E3P99_01265 [Wallemia hederae]